MTRIYRRRRLRALLGVALVLCLTAAAYASPPGHRGSAPSLSLSSTGGWPRVGQGAYVRGGGRVSASAGQRPVPIASLAKVMTAYVMLRHGSAMRFSVSQADVDDTAVRRRGGQSVVAVRNGETLTERQALLAILLPSANNVAVLAARQVSGSVPAFVGEMNRAARALGMTRTTYTDPSGYDAGTVSTATDQLKLARVAAREPALAAVMATRSAWLPVAGVVSNTDTLLGQDGFTGMKTGSDAAAGGCFMFHAGPVVGVVLGQQGSNLIAAGLFAARQLVQRLEAK
jgi:D-alanyl-D-alanine carboxypeptidase (penicillin-binding protein 5/6)